MNILKVKGNNTHQYIRLHGDKKTQLEPNEFSVRFPGGHVCVSRCSDGTFWAHIDCNNDPLSSPDVDGLQRGKFLEGRIDCWGLPAAQSDIGSLARDDCRHVAMRIAKA